jgi:hypothetical protein
MGKRKDRSARRIADVLRPGETIHIQAICREGTGLVPAQDDPQLVAAITDDRLLIFKTTFWGFSNSGKLLHQIALDRVRHVESKTGHTLRIIPYVRTRVEYANGQVLEIVSPGFTARKARSLGEALTSRTEVRPGDSRTTPSDG